MTGTLQEQHGSSVSFSVTPAVVSRGIFAQCPQRPVGLSEMGTSGKAGKKSETSKQVPTQKTKAAVDRRQNNKMLQQRPSGIAQRPHNCCPNCHTEQSQRQCPQLRCWETTEAKEVQLHLPAPDLFGANLWVQHYLPPLDLIWICKSV